MAGGDSQNLIIKMCLTFAYKTIKFNNMDTKKIQRKIISIFIDPALIIKVRVMAAKKSKSIGEVIEEALRLFFSK